MYCLTAEAVSYICPVVYTTGWGTRVGAVVLDRQSVVPLYYQIQQSLSEQIRSGELKPGALMPSEQEIAARLGGSRMTARKPLKSLGSGGPRFTPRCRAALCRGLKRETRCGKLLPSREDMKS